MFGVVPRRSPTSPISLGRPPPPAGRRPPSTCSFHSGTGAPTSQHRRPEPSSLSSAISRSRNSTDASGRRIGLLEFDLIFLLWPRLPVEQGFAVRRSARHFLRQFASQALCLVGWPREVGRIEVILAGNPDKREEGVTAGIGERRTPPMRGLADGADWPVGGNPFSGSMGQDGRQIDRAGGLVDGGRLHGSDLVLSQGLAHDVEPARQRRIAKRLLRPTDPTGSSLPAIFPD